MILIEVLIRLAQMVERRTTVRGGQRFEPQTGPTLRVLK